MGEKIFELMQSLLEILSLKVQFGKKEKTKFLISQKLLKNEVSLHRFGKFIEIADLVSFLSSPRASFIACSVYVIDGGQIR